MATALPDNLKSIFPDAAIDVLVRKGNESLFIGNPNVARVLTWDKKEGKTRKLFNLITVVKQSHYDAVVNLQRFFSTGLITTLSGAKEKVGFDKNPFSALYTRSVQHIMDGRHEVDRNNELIAHWGEPKLKGPKVYLGESDLETVENYKTEPYICIAPTSVWFTKQWPGEKWVKFVQALPNGLRVYLMGAPNDKVACDAIRKEVDANTVTNLCGELSLLQSAALMKDARMNYVNDSAPMHLASAVNASVTAVFCSTIPKFGFGPLSDNSHVVEINDALDCRPCGLHGLKACPQGHFKCAMEIDIQRLVKVIE